MTGPVIIQFQDEQDRIVLTEKETNLVTVFERQPNGKHLRDIVFPMVIHQNEGDDPRKAVNIYKEILRAHGWRERGLDEAEQRGVLLDVIQDLSSRHLYLQAELAMRGSSAHLHAVNRYKRMQ